jgi:hypothetical protein
MYDEQNRLIRGCERWKNRLAYYLSLKPTIYHIDDLCRSSTYLISWLNDLHDYDERVYEKSLSSSKYFLNKASETIFNYFYLNCRHNTHFSLNSKRYVKSVGELIDHMYYVLWCSYYGGNDDFLDHVFNVFLSDIATNLPPTSNLKGRSEKYVGRALWEILTYFEKLLDYDVPLWAIQKFQTKNLTKPKINEDETYNIMMALDSVELSLPIVTEDVRYRVLRNELLRSTEFGARERRKVLKNALRQRCECGAPLKLMKSDITLNKNRDNLVLITETVCKVCGRYYNSEDRVEKTKVEFSAFDQLDEYLNQNYGVSLIQRIKNTLHK